MRFVSTLIGAAACLALCSGAALAGSPNNLKGAHPASPYVKQVGAKFSTADAPKVLYYVDFVLGSDTFATALSNLGLAATQTNDPVQFNDLMAGGGWDLVIVQQNNECLASNYGATLASYIAGGGKAIGADWCAGNDTTIAAAFGAQASGTNDAGAITPGSGALWSGINDPFTLSNPGWGIYSVGLAPLAGDATGSGTYDNGGSAVIIANGGRTYMNGTLEDSYADTNQAVLFDQNEIQAVLNGSGGSNVTGTIAGTGRARVVCLNITTRKTTSFMSKGGTFDCGAHGLKISAGDKVSVTLVGGAK